CGSPSTCCGGGAGGFLIGPVDTDFVVRGKDSRNLEDQPAGLLGVSRRRTYHQLRHGMHLLCGGFMQGFSGDPIASTGPFFSLILAAIFVRDVEHVTVRIVLSAVMIVGGVVLLTLWK